MKLINSIQRDKLLHFSVMTLFAVVAFTASLFAGFRCPLVSTLGSALVLAVGWEAFWYIRRRKTGAKQNTPREMALDIVAGMAGAFITMLPVAILAIRGPII